MRDIKVRRIFFFISFFSGMINSKILFSLLSIPNSRPPVGRLHYPVHSLSKARQLWMVNNKL